MSDIPDLTLTALASAIRRRKVSSVEATRALLARIAQRQGTLNAFVSIEEEAALKSARAADRALKRGGRLGSLHGVPLAHKDMYYSAGLPCGCGSKIRAGWVAGETATAVQRLEAAGSFRLGALNMAEFAYGPTGHNAHHGPARNPWNTAHITGGSSSGSGAAVAARLVPAALGSDTGGSIRLPAHFCGVTGFKPTNNRVSRANAMPLSFTLDSVGPLARTAEDCALVMRIIAGEDPLDPATAGAPAWNAKAAARPVKGMKVAVPEDFYLDDLEPDVAAAFDAAVASLRKLGAKIVKVKLPDQTLITAAAMVVIASESTAYHAPWLRTRRADYGAQVGARLENGLAYSAVEYLEALRFRGPALAQHLEAIGDADIVLAPACRAAAPTIEETDVGGGAAAERIIGGLTRLMRAVNFLGLPAMVVPAGQSAAGLPIGVQLIGRPFRDETIAVLGIAFQRETDHHLRAPVLA